MTSQDHSGQDDATRQIAAALVFAAAIADRANLDPAFRAELAAMWARAVDLRAGGATR